MLYKRNNNNNNNTTSATTTTTTTTTKKKKMKEKKKSAEEEYQTCICTHMKREVMQFIICPIDGSTTCNDVMTVTSRTGRFRSRRH